MDPIDKFLKLYSYKFDKGYPDMNNERDILLLETIFKKEFNIVLKEAAADAKIVKTLIDTNPGFFATQSDDRRIANKKKISADEFVKIVKDTFNIDNVIVHPPNSGPNKKPSVHSSSKFNMFEFNVDGRKYLIILSGGAAANKGQDFEDKITLGLQDAIGLSINDIEDEKIKQILNKLNINPQDITKVEQTGGQDTKRTINPEAGPQDRGKTISDVTIIANNKPYYLSIKNKTGDNIYNGGTISSITYNKENNKIEFDQNKFNSDKLKQSVFNMFDIDPIKVTDGLNNYIEDKGETPSWRDIDIDKDEVMGFIGSAVDYGYYYVREEGNGIKVIHLESPEDVAKLIGKISYAKVKYPGNGVKSTYARVGLEDSEQGLRYIEVQIRNASGGIANPVIKVQTK